MKKLSIGILVGIGVAYLAATWIMGREIERRVGDTDALLNARSPAVHVVDSRFQRGFFTSEQTLTLEVLTGLPAVMKAKPSAPAAPLRLIVHSVIHHGPVCGWTCLGLAQIDSQIDFGEPLRTLLAGAFGSSQPLVVRTRLGVFGGGHSTLSSPAVRDAALADGGHLSSDGLTVDGRYGAHYDSYEVRGALPHVLYGSAQGSVLELTGGALDLHSKRVSGTLFVGDQSVTLARANFGTGRATGLAIHGVDLTTHTSANDGFMDMATRLGTGAVVSAPLTLTNTHIDITLRHFDIQSLDALNEAMRQANQDPSVPPLARLATLVPALKQPAFALFAKDPVIIIDRIGVATAAGAATVTGTLKLNGIVAADFADGADPRALVQKVDVDLNLSVDEAFLAGMPGTAKLMPQIQDAVTKGLITRTDGTLRTELTFRRGEATANGKLLAM